MPNDRQELRDLFQGDSGKGSRVGSLPQEEGLSKLSKLAKEAQDWAEQAALYEAKLAAARAEVQHRLVVKIPEIMNEIGIKDFTLTDGTTLEIKDVYSASISEENQTEAFGWLTKNKFGSLIKTNLVVNVGRATPAQLKGIMSAVAKALKTARIESRPTIKEQVNPQTLKAFVKEQLTQGNPKKMPLDVFGARTFQLAKMTPPKEKT